MDFILEMHSLDNPDTFTFERPNANTKRLAFQRVHVSWANVLIGKTRADFLKQWVPKLPREYAQKPGD